MCVLSEVSEGYQMGTLQVTLLGSWKAEAGEPLRVQKGPPVCLRHKEDSKCVWGLPFFDCLSYPSVKAILEGLIHKWKDRCWNVGARGREEGRKGAALERQVTAAGYSHLTVPSLRLHPEALCSPPLSALLEWLFPSQLSLLLFFHMEHKNQRTTGSRGQRRPLGREPKILDEQSRKQFQSWLAKLCFHKKIQQFHRFGTRQRKSILH